MWLLSNILTKYTNPSNQLLYSDEGKEGNCDIKQNMQWLIAGHVHSRRSKHSSVDKFQGLKLVETLFNDYGFDFIQHITGQFIIIYVESNKFTIYSDHFAIRKFFIWQLGKDFIITDDLNTVAQIVPLKPSKTSIAIYAIDYHFTGGTTAFANVKLNEPGQVIEFKDGKLNFSYHWKPAGLLKRIKRNITIPEISEALSNAVDNGLHNLDSDKISLSLTGGADTRSLLAVFLSKGIKPHLYTYGNPNSDDCIKAKAIAEGFGLSHCIHDIDMTADLFEAYARKIVRQNYGIASIHRAHRVIAVEWEKQYANNMFLGTLGGEFIKGVSEDDYIVPAIVYENWQNQNFTIYQLRAYLHKKFIKPEAVDDDGLLPLVQSKPYMTGSISERKHNALIYITAHLHDAQDVNLYRSVMQNVFTPFLDIDYLELIFSSEFTFDNKENIENKYLKRVNNPVYASQFLKATFPPLLKYLYSGDHKPADVIFNKYYAALMKIYRKRRTSGKYQPNFPLGKWMEEFVKRNLPLCSDFNILKETFNLEGLMQEFKNGIHKPKEAYWLKFTNPIMMRFIIEEFSMP